ncbi:hypothetical protein [Amycolatopsis aidingensis]|uniref:hypothetical protein n=1 Tax=Amycolatopsis aidingensis TaxID=2842453 RepID=UPI001E3511B6|nr:hypothetical protein [Amycolatopsis aidingensis]
MSSYTDFYFGRGENANWLGSLRGECCPENFLTVPPSRLALAATDESTFRPAVADTLGVWEDERLGQAYRRELGWPWPWYTSHDSSWIIVFDPAPRAVFVTVGGGVTWHRIDPHDPQFPEGDDPLGPDKHLRVASRSGRTALGADAADAPETHHYTHLRR